MKVLDITQDDNVGARVSDKLKGRVAFVTGARAASARPPTAISGRRGSGLPEHRGEP